MDVPSKSRLFASKYPVIELCRSPENNPVSNHVSIDFKSRCTDSSTRTRTKTPKTRVITLFSRIFKWVMQIEKKGLSKEIVPLLKRTTRGRVTVHLYLQNRITLYYPIQKLTVYFHCSISTHNTIFSRAKVCV